MYYWMMINHLKCQVYFHNKFIKHFQIYLYLKMSACFGMRIKCLILQDYVRNNDISRLFWQQWYAKIIFATVNLPRLYLQQQYAKIIFAIKICQDYIRNNDKPRFYLQQWFLKIIFATKIPQDYIHNNYMPRLYSQ